MSSDYIHSYHTDHTTPNTKEFIETIIYALRESKIDFDCIACRGFSGLAVASIIAYEMEKKLIFVRSTISKKITHADDRLECSGISMSDKRYIIIDDFISSGKTFFQIIKQIKSYYDDMEYVGAVLYNALDVSNIICNDKLYNMIGDKPIILDCDDDPAIYWTCDSVRESI